MNLQEVKISDVVMISSVILGTNQGLRFSNYDYLAADVDAGTERLNVLDMVAIQRVILGLDNNFTVRAKPGALFLPTSM